MPKQVRELMSQQPITLSTSTPIIEAARRMRAANVGSVIVEENGRPCGIVTDRDIAIRAVADGRPRAHAGLRDQLQGPDGRRPGR